MTNFQTLRATVRTKLGTVTELQVVEDKHTSALSGFPAATFEPSGNQNLFLTNAENQRRYAYDIVIHQEVTKAGRDEAVRILGEAVDAVISAFDTDFNLGSTVDWVEALPSAWDQYKSGSATVLYAMINLVIVTNTQVVT